MVKTVTFGSAISLTVTNLEGSSETVAFIYSKTARVKTAQKRFLGVHGKQKQ